MPVQLGTSTAQRTSEAGGAEPRLSDAWYTHTANSITVHFNYVPGLSRYWLAWKEAEPIMFSEENLQQDGHYTGNEHIEEDPEEVITITVTGLEPDSLYYCRLVGCDEE